MKSKIIFTNSCLLKGGGLLKRQRKLSTVAKEIVVNKDTKKAKKYFNMCLNLLEMYSDYGFVEYAYLVFQMCLDSLQGKYRMSNQTLFMLLVTVIYIVSPLDFIPDVVPFLGQMDDLSILVYCISACSSEVDSYVAYKQKLAM